MTDLNVTPLQIRHDLEALQHSVNQMADVLNRSQQHIPSTTSSLNASITNSIDFSVPAPASASASAFSKLRTFLNTSTSTTAGENDTNSFLMQHQQQQQQQLLLLQQRSSGMDSSHRSPLPLSAPLSPSPSSPGAISSTSSSTDSSPDQSLSLSFRRLNASTLSSSSVASLPRAFPTHTHPSAKLQYYPSSVQSIYSALLGQENEGKKQKTTKNQQEKDRHKNSSTDKRATTAHRDERENEGRKQAWQQQQQQPASTEYGYYPIKATPPVENQHSFFSTRHEFGSRGNQVGSGLTDPPGFLPGRRDRLLHEMSASVPQSDPEVGERGEEGERSLPLSSFSVLPSSTVGASSAAVPRSSSSDPLLAAIEAFKEPALPSTFDLSALALDWTPSPSLTSSSSLAPPPSSFSLSYDTDVHVRRRNDGGSKPKKKKKATGTTCQTSVRHSSSKSEVHSSFNDSNTSQRAVRRSSTMNDLQLQLQQCKRELVSTQHRLRDCQFASQEAHQVNKKLALNLASLRGKAGEYAQLSQELQAVREAYERSEELRMEMQRELDLLKGEREERKKRGNSSQGIMRVFVSPSTSSSSNKNNFDILPSSTNSSSKSNSTSSTPLKAVYASMVLQKPTISSKKKKVKRSATSSSPFLSSASGRARSSGGQARVSSRTGSSSSSSNRWH